MTTLTDVSNKSARKTTKGTAFLIEDSAPEDIFTPEDLSEEHLAVGHMVEEFWTHEVEPNLPAIREKKPGVALSVLRKSVDLGLTAMAIPEEYGGMAMDLPSLMVTAERLGRDGSYGGWHSAHTGIGTLPIVYFGNEQQKRKYLPKLGKLEMLAAYALTEPLAGSDALAARTRADLSPDGKHYILNGQKMWITNGGAADFYTIFAKVDGEKFTAFLVERKFPGVAPGAEEKNMAIKGRSITAIYLDNVPGPLESVLGEIGRGHIIAFNILNIGRLKLGAFACGGAKEVLRVSLNYAKERKAFGKSIAEFGMIQHKLAEMAIRIFAAESATYRVVGLIEGELANQTELKAIEEFAAECSYIKIFASEMLDYVTDEAVQIHGGYGYHQDYIVERAYRDSRINRIFEGTNEINRLLATGMIMKRAQKGLIPMMEAGKKLQAEIMAGPQLGAEVDLVANAKKIGLFAMGMAGQKYGTALEEQQEVVANITDILMNAYALESATLRTEKIARSGKNAENAREMTAVFAHDAMETIESAAKTELAACGEGDALGTNLAVLKRFTKYDPEHQ